MNKDFSKIKVIAALIFGSLVGITLGVLFAPNKGRKTRKRLIGKARNWATDIKEQMKEEALDLRNKADEIELLAQEELLVVSSSKKPNAIVLQQLT